MPLEYAETRVTARIPASHPDRPIPALSNDPRHHQAWSWGSFEWCPVSTASPVRATLSIVSAEQAVIARDPACPSLFPPPVPQLRDQPPPLDPFTRTLRRFWSSRAGRSQFDAFEVEGIRLNLGPRPLPRRTTRDEVWGTTSAGRGAMSHPSTPPVRHRSDSGGRERRLELDINHSNPLISPQTSDHSTLSFHSWPLIA